MVAIDLITTRVDDLLPWWWDRGNGAYERWQNNRLFPLTCGTASHIRDWTRSEGGIRRRRWRRSNNWFQPLQSKHKSIKMTKMGIYSQTRFHFMPNRIGTYELKNLSFYDGKKTTYVYWLDNADGLGGIRHEVTWGLPPPGILDEGTRSVEANSGNGVANGLPSQLELLAQDRTPGARVVVSTWENNEKNLNEAILRIQSSKGIHQIYATMVVNRITGSCRIKAFCAKDLSHNQIRIVEQHARATSFVKLSEGGPLQVNSANGEWDQFIYYRQLPNGPPTMPPEGPPCMVRFGRRVGI